MRLPDFILTNIEPILAEWESFARDIWPPSAAVDPAELRDHAEQILRASVSDMECAQTSGERAEKSKGAHRPGAQSRELNVASVQHGVGRVASGFKLKELVAEYRALRASVISLWRASRPDPDRRDLDDLTRFNESIDQSLAKAVNSFTDRVDRSRQLFLAVLGHDLRNPLNAMTMTSAVLERETAGNPEAAGLVAQMAASADAMSRMITDLLDFTGTGLGAGMPITRVATHLNLVCGNVVDEIHAANPGCKVTVTAKGDLSGTWDPSRLRQLISNLLGNAVQHGSDECDVTLTLRGERDAVFLSVHNNGEPIPPESLSTIFDPLVRARSPESEKRRRPGSIGLGLYIAREVVTAHGGTIDVTSSAEAGTTFTVNLPRHA
jgi:signal transduction histidine kinase